MSFSNQSPAVKFSGPDFLRDGLDGFFSDEERRAELHLLEFRDFLFLEDIINSMMVLSWAGVPLYGQQEILTRAASEILWRRTK